MLAVDDRIERVASPAGDYNPVAARGELLRERAPDARTSAGDKDRIARQFILVLLLLASSLRSESAEGRRALLVLPNVLVKLSAVARVSGVGWIKPDV